MKIAGTPDAVGDHHVIEIKTAKKIPREPFESHLMQLNAYLWMLDYRMGYLVYIDKNTGEVKVFQHKYDPELLLKFLKRAYNLRVALEFHELPEPEPSGLCNFCEWKLICYENKNESRDRLNDRSTSPS